MNSAESREGLLTQIIEDALRREKNAGASFREMKALAKDYALLPDDKRAECEAIYERARVAMESARAAMDALIADPRLARHMEAEMIEEARRERPAYDTSRVA